MFINKDFLMLLSDEQNFFIYFYKIIQMFRMCFNENRFNAKIEKFFECYTRKIIDYNFKK